MARRKYQLTKEQRLAIYKNALRLMHEDIEKHGSLTSGLCGYLYSRPYSLESPSPYFHMDEYPEINRCKPHKPDIDLAGGYWFKLHTEYGRKKRLAILNKAIEKLSEENRILEK